MSRVLAIFVKEVRSYFLSPIAYVVLTGFMVLAGLSFYYQMVHLPDVIQAAYQSGELAIIKQNRINHFLIAPFLDDVSLIMIFLIPILTMRLFSEEKRMKTDELLLTSPVTVNQIVVAKFLAGLFFALLLVLSTFVYIALLFIYSDPDPGTTLTSYMAIVFFITCVVSIGIFTSSVTENQIVASVACLIIELLFATLSVASKSVNSPVLARTLGYISFQSHMRSFMDGVILSDDLVYFISFVFLFLFLTNRSVESSRWR